MTDDLAHLIDLVPAIADDSSASAVIKGEIVGVEFATAKQLDNTTDNGDF